MQNMAHKWRTFTFYLKIYIWLGENTSLKSKIYTHRYFSVAKIFKIYPFLAEHPRQHLVLSYPPPRGNNEIKIPEVGPGASLNARYRIAPLKLK